MVKQRARCPFQQSITSVNNNDYKKDLLIYWILVAAVMGIFLIGMIVALFR
jgi:hypothetical protein